MNRKHIPYLSLLVFAGAMLLGSQKSFCQLRSFHTNTLGWATAQLNLEYGMRIGHHWSLQIPVQYSPFSFAKGTLRHIALTPGVRYWIREPYGRSYFFGMQGMGTIFNVGGVLGGSYRYQGYGVGSGLSVGYSRPLSVRWNIEFEVGLGVMWQKYDKFICQDCGRKVDSRENIRLAPTKLAVNIVYLF